MSVCGHRTKGKRAAEGLPQPCLSALDKLKNNKTDTAFFYTAGLQWKKERFRQLPKMALVFLKALTFLRVCVKKKKSRVTKKYSMHMHKPHTARQIL